MTFSLEHVVSLVFAVGLVIVLAGFALRHPRAFGDMLRDAEAFARASLGSRGHAGADIPVHERDLDVAVKRPPNIVRWAAVRRLRVSAAVSNEARSRSEL